MADQRALSSSTTYIYNQLPHLQPSSQLSIFQQHKLQQLVQIYQQQLHNLKGELKPQRQLQRNNHVNSSLETFRPATPLEKIIPKTNSTIPNVLANTTTT